MRMYVRMTIPAEVEQANTVLVRTIVPIVTVSPRHNRRMVQSRTPPNGRCANGGDIRG